MTDPHDEAAHVAGETFDPGAPLGATGLLMAELWYEQVPDLQDTHLRDRLAATFPGLETRDLSFVIPHPDLTVQMEQGPMPLLTAVFAASTLDQAGKQKPSTAQTWDWPGADAALERSTGSLLASELLASFFAPSQRLEALRRVVGALITETAPAAVSWPNSQQVTDPATFADHQLNGPINVRFFTMTGEGDEPDSTVMDTLGLHVFDLPDVQCHFRDRDPGQVAALLLNTAHYIFEAGDVIDDGHTVSGPTGEERYLVRHESALAEPIRPVIDIDLGPPYAVGVRR
ncbi:hypothetical protein JOE57_002830 [Microlunatus panaciterrae]|uniref:DUF4261 domain-containing protein n=1 Tax=Microlunatus panaciterrae TaxID=400768 RepID=A0ABS2RPN7_9ACTN|nr:DUF4261 domain-containing protein [Microlunatus panaciterrae]MBM7799909.1 hypothetical protein [Microlunatus panaciterrae]